MLKGEGVGRRGQGGREMDSATQKVLVKAGCGRMVVALKGRRESSRIPSSELVKCRFRPQYGRTLLIYKREEARRKRAGAESKASEKGWRKLFRRVADSPKKATGRPEKGCRARKALGHDDAQAHVHSCCTLHAGA
eukprot:6210877-Pleurochrysis_carterae.AAC.1